MRLRRSGKEEQIRVEDWLPTLLARAALRQQREVRLKVYPGSR
jgi:hypothetical protein